MLNIHTVKFSRKLISVINILNNCTTYLFNPHTLLYLFAVLIYEPTNEEALQFQPLINEKIQLGRLLRVVQRLEYV